MLGFNYHIAKNAQNMTQFPNYVLNLYCRQPCLYQFHVHHAIGEINLRSTMAKTKDFPCYLAKS